MECDNMAHQSPYPHQSVPVVQQELHGQAAASSSKLPMPISTRVQAVSSCWDRTNRPPTAVPGPPEVLNWMGASTGSQQPLRFPSPIGYSVKQLQANHPLLRDSPAYTILQPLQSPSVPCWALLLCFSAGVSGLPGVTKSAVSSKPPRSEPRHQESIACFPLLLCWSFSFLPLGFNSHLEPSWIPGNHFPPPSFPHMVIFQCLDTKFWRSSFFAVHLTAIFPEVLLFIWHLSFILLMCCLDFEQVKFSWNNLIFVVKYYI